MEKMLSKSKSRFFGKKKSTKNLGISNSDPPGTESEKRSESLGGMLARPILSTSSPSIVPGGTSAMMLNGSRLHHGGYSSMGSENVIGHGPDNPIPSPARPSNDGPVSQSRFEVHITPTAFSPIIIPSSTSPESFNTSAAKKRGISSSGGKYSAPSAERTPRAGDGPGHGRSQSSVSPDQNPSSRSRSRRHGIPANFLESVGAAMGDTKSHWNGQSLGADHFMNSQTLHERSPSSFPSETVLVRPSTSAPATSSLANSDNGFTLPELAPILESVTVPSMFPSSSGHSPLPRSSPSYNLAALTPSSSANAVPRRPAEVDQRPVPKSNRGALPQPPVHDPPHRPPCGPSQPPSPPSPTRRYDTVMAPHQSLPRHRPSPSASSETEIGYKGLVFPLPPSSEEGLAMSFSSSQTSLFSMASTRRSGDQPMTPKRIREVKPHGEGDRDAKMQEHPEPRGPASGSGRSARDRSISLSVSEDRASPTPSIKTMRKRRDGVNEHFERDPQGERNTIKNVQDRVTKELEDVLGVQTNEETLPMVGDSYPATRVRATSEALRPHPAGARPQKQSAKQPEPTKPLVLNSARKPLHMVRSFTTLAERKQIHASSSNRDLSASFNSANARGERSRTVTAIPVRVGPVIQRERDVPDSASASPSQAQSDEQPQIPPSFPLPTPPNSSSALSFLTSETKTTESMPSRLHAELPHVPLSTLDEVTNALRTQRVRFDELAGYVLDVAQRHAAEKDAYVERVGRLEGTVAKMEREIRGLRWLVLENTKARTGTAGAGMGIIMDAVAGEMQDLEGEKTGDGKVDEAVNQRKLRRSSTMPQLPMLFERPGHARNRRFGGVGLDFSPDSAASSPFTLSPPATSSRFPHEVDKGESEHTPSMDDIIDKLMAVRQWAGADVRVSVVESAGDGGNSKRIVFKEV